MRQKISTGLIATNGDGKPSVRPPVPAGWCTTGSSNVPAGETQDVKFASLHSPQVNDVMSSQNNSSSSSPQNHAPSFNGLPRGLDDFDKHTSKDVSGRADGSNIVGVESADPLCEITPVADSVPPTQTLPSINNPNPAMSEDSNVDVETEEQNTPGNNSMPDVEPEESMTRAELGASGRLDPDPHDQDEDSEMSDARYIEKQVVESFLNVASNELQGLSDGKNGTSMSKNGGTSSFHDNNLYRLPSKPEKELPATSEGMSMPNSSTFNKLHKTLDPVSMTIASVAAGEGGPPEFLNRTQTDHQREGFMTYHHHHLHNQVASLSKHKKAKIERSISASARLPVISSLLAPVSSSSHASALPGIHHIASSHGKISSSPTTVLPSVAHFLGPAKSPPTAYVSRQPSTETFGSPLTNASSDTNDSGHLGSHYQPGTPSSALLSSSKSKNSRKPVTPAGLRLSLAASEELPDPLPVPQYSDKVIRAKQLGTVAFDRPTVLRETVQFFLQYKHYWSSHDYDRISNLVIELFPEFKDNNDTPGVPANKRIRTDLSMYARNFRRREVSQRKKESPVFPSNSLDQRSEVGVNNGQETPGKNFYSPPSPTNNSSGPTATGGSNNPSDFCNELLTAASIIESQNTASAGRNREMGSQITHSHHKLRVSSEAGVPAHSGILQQKQELDEEEEVRKHVIMGHHKPRGEALEDDPDDTPIHFVYDKDTMAAAASREASVAWQMYSEQMAQAMAVGNAGIDYGVSEQAIKKDLGTCARNMRRRLPSVKYKTNLTSQKSWNNSQPGIESQMSETASTSTTLMPGTAEYMKAFMAAQNMNLTELGMTQRNLGELALLAGIKQRIEQYPQEVTDLERQYLAQCSTEEQRQALMASGAFGSDTAAMAALSAFYGLGMDITSTKRGLGTADYNASSTHDTSTLAAPELEVPSKRQRRISQAEVEKRLREAEQNHGLSHHEHSEDKSHGLVVGVSDTHLVKREPMSPAGENVKASSKLQQQQQQQHHQQLSVPMSVFSTASTGVIHDPTYWDTQAATNMALTGLTHPGPQPAATQAHSQAHVQHLAGHDPAAHPNSDAPMNLTYHESDKHLAHRLNTDSPMPDSLPDTAGLAAQVEVTTSSVKSHSPRRRASSSPRSSQQDPSLNSRDQVKLVWFPHGAGFKKENQEIVCLPDPLPIPNYSQKIVNAREEGSSMRHRSEIIRETARFFLGHKYWWSSADYTRISELVVQQFPDLKDDSSADGLTNYRRIQRDLSMCARNLRRSKKPRKMRDLSGDPSNTLLDIPETPRIPKKHGKISKSSMFSSNLDKRAKRLAGSSYKHKKIKHEPAAAVVSEPSATSGVSEDITAAAALLQQQFMQPSSTSSYHPSAHLLPSSHLLPSLHTHPAIHEQQMQSQITSAMLQQQTLQDGHLSVEDSHASKRHVKEEAGIQESMEHSFTGVKSNAVAPIQRTVSPSVDNNQGGITKTAQSHVRGLDGTVLSKEEHEKMIQPPAPPPTTMKVYADPDHGNDLQERFSTLWRKGKFFDASLGVTNKKLHVHKLVLLAMSPYLQETFKNADPRSQLEVNLPSDTTYETAKAFLKYIYEGVLEVDTSSVRSLHKIATMLQMTKLAQYCQNFAQQLQEEAEQANGIGAGGDGEIPKISVNLGELTDVQGQRQRQLEAQALQRLSEASVITSSDVQRASASRYMSSDEHVQLKGDYLTTGDQSSNEQMVNAPNFLHQDVLAQHRALVAASSSLQSSNPSLLMSSSQEVATQQLIQAALARHQASSSPQPSSSMYQQHHQHMVTQNDANAALLHRLTSPDSSVTAAGATSLDHQQRLAFAAYWQAHTLGELMSRNQVTGLTSDPSSLTSASELAAIAAAAAATSSEDTRHLLSNIGHHESKIKTSHSRSHHSKQTSWSNQVGDSDSGHHATMLPETCIPADMARTHVNSSGGS